MISYKLFETKLVLLNHCVNDNNNDNNSSDIKETIKLLKEKHVNAINSQNNMFEYPNCEKILSFYNPYKYIYKKLYDEYNIVNYTNAWFKCYELISYFNLIKLNGNFTLFDNAALPGSFILATNHYIRTLTNIRYFRWYANSLINNDKYYLFKNYPSRWMMDEHNNGDITNFNNIQEIFHKIIEFERNGVNLYLSDVGFTFKDFTNEESEYYFHNLGQILTGLYVLKKGGHMIFKQYTFFNNNSISLLAILTNLFQDVHISKPLSSKSHNSEIYVVCKGYGGIDKKILSIISSRLKNKDTTPITTFYYNEYFNNSIINALHNIYNRQIFYIKERLSWFNEIIITDNDKNKNDNNTKLIYKKAIDSMIYKSNDMYRIWINLYILKKINSKFIPKMKKIYPHIYIHKINK